jgi:hypothetical protein
MKRAVSHLGAARGQRRAVARERPATAMVRLRLVGLVPVWGSLSVCFFFFSSRGCEIANGLGWTRLGYVLGELCRGGHLMGGWRQTETLEILGDRSLPFADLLCSCR